jgi:hypothetical protein
MAKWRIRHDARIARAYESHIIEAHNINHAESLMRATEDLDWDSGRFDWTIEMVAE